MKKSLVLFLLIMIANNVFADKATIKGKIFNYEQDVMYMYNYTSLNTLFKKENHEIKLKENHRFDYTFDIESPAYYKIGRIYLYISPGDNITMNIDNNSRKNCTFEGKGAEANRYLTNHTYPKGGSFWGEEEIRKGNHDYKELPEKFEIIRKKMEEKIDNLDNVSDEFISLERARLDFEYVNSLLNVSYLYYPQLVRKQINEKEMNEKMSQALDYYKPYITKYLHSFNSLDYLQFEVFQSVLYSLRDERFRKEHKLKDLSEELKEYIKTTDIIDSFSRNLSSELLAKDYSKELTKKEYIDAVNEVKTKFAKLAKGAPAIDINFTNYHDKEIKLSDYKGDVIVVDIWATWCGPCMQEKPFFEKLAKKFEGEEVVFLTVSVDNRKAWKAYFKNHHVSENQLHIYRDELTPYQIKGIPRFMVIDKDFKIVDAFAPRPSSVDLEKMINKTLNK